jgi:hypothetical protein
MPGKCPKGKKWSKEKGKCVLKDRVKTEKVGKRTYEKGGKHEFRSYSGDATPKKVRYKKGLKMQEQGKGRMSSYRAK